MKSSERNPFHGAIVLVAALAAAAYAVGVLSRRPLRRREPDDAGGPAEQPAARTTSSILTWGEAPREPSGRRAAVAFAVTTLFFAGAAVTAGAGDDPARVLEETTEATTTAEPADPVPATEPPPADPVSEPPPAAEPPPPASAEPPPAEEPGPTPVAASPDEAQPARSSSTPTPNVSQQQSATFRPPAARARRKQPARPKPTAEQEVAVHGGTAVIWLRRPLPDPTPRARRLDRWFVYDLLRASRGAEVDWALALGVVRARGHGGRRPVDVVQLDALSNRLREAGAARDAEAAALAVTGSEELAQKAIALARYNRAVGTETLVRGLAARKDALVERLLADRRVEIYAGGRDDLALGRVDVRVVALMSYLAESFGQVSVSSLFSGHGVYARPGVVSAHVYGHAVDVAGLGGLSITGRQEPGGLTEEAVRSILLLPAELQPRQVISLLGLGGASFPLADHHDHIHVGY